MPEVPPRLAFSTLGCPDWTWNQILDSAGNDGYEGLEIRLLQRETDLLKVPEFLPLQRSARRRECRSAGVVVCGLASSIRFHETDLPLRNSQIETGKRYLELAADLGAGMIRVFGDVLSPEALAENPAALTRELNWIAEGLSQLGELARPYEIDILLETHGDFTATRHLPELMRLVNHPQVGLLWDTHHPWRFHGESPELTWNRIGPWVRHTHWKDSDSRLPSDDSPETQEVRQRAIQLMSGHRSAQYCRFLEGEFPAQNCLHALRLGGYSGWFSLEWEKAWHPEIEDPAYIFPHFADRFKSLWKTLPDPSP